MDKTPEKTSIITLRPYAVDPFWDDDSGIVFWLWRRQAGKSFHAGAKALRRMMQYPGLLSVFVSASIALGVEFIRKEALIWRMVMEASRKAAAEAGLRLTTSADDDSGDILDIDALSDLFEHQRLETRIYHDRTTYSRSVVVAPNPDTAVGWTGDIWMDEVGRMPEFKDLLEAVLPFMSSNPQYRLLMITTPPPDDSHYSWELFLPPQESFPVNPLGNYYTSQAGYKVHRVDAYDAYAAGVSMYDDKTREPISPDEHRARAFDKTAWDRNFGLQFVSGGSSALSLSAITRSMAMQSMTPCAAIDISEEIVL